jgi:heptosyltransferase III
VTAPASLLCSLVYHTGGLGDFITALPALDAWNKSNPGLRKILLGKPAYGVLGIGEGLFDEVWDAGLPEFARLYLADAPLDARSSTALERVTAAFLFAAAASPLSIRFGRLGLSRLIVHDPFPPDKIHICDYHLSCVKHGGVPHSDAYPRLTPHPAGAAEPDAAAGPGERIAAIHPGSGSPKKNWPFDRYLDLAEKLRAQGFCIIWISGPAEERQFLFPASERVFRDASLPALVRVLSRSSLFVGNDSGISHLAAAAGAPSVVLFGPSDPAVWAPRGRTVAIVCAGEQACFPCHPDANASARPCAKPCMNTVAVAHVFESCMAVQRKN